MPVYYESIKFAWQSCILAASIELETAAADCAFIYVSSICVILLISVHSFHKCGCLFHRTVHCQCDHIWKYHSRIVLEDTHFETERQASHWIEMRASCHTQIYRHMHARIHLCICSDCNSSIELLLRLL